MASGLGILRAREAKFLPTELSGVRVLVEEADNYWRSTNVEFSTLAPGLAFRKSKNLDDKFASDFLEWGDAVYGCSEGDGWLLCDDTQANFGTDSAFHEHFHISAAIPSAFSATPPAGIAATYAAGVAQGRALDVSVGATTQANFETDASFSAAVPSAFSAEAPAGGPATNLAGVAQGRPLDVSAEVRVAPGSPAKSPAGDGGQLDAIMADIRAAQSRALDVSAGGRDTGHDIDSQIPAVGGESFEVAGETVVADEAPIAESDAACVARWAKKYDDMNLRQQELPVSARKEVYASNAATPRSDATPSAALPATAPTGFAGLAMEFSEISREVVAEVEEVGVAVEEAAVEVVDAVEEVVAEVVQWRTESEIEEEELRRLRERYDAIERQLSKLDPTFNVGVEPFVQMVGVETCGWDHAASYQGHESQSFRLECIDAKVSPPSKQLVELDCWHGVLDAISYAETTLSSSPGCHSPFVYVLSSFSPKFAARLQGTRETTDARREADETEAEYRASKASCESRAPMVGDEVGAWKQTIAGDTSWKLRQGEIAIVTKVDSDGDLMLCNPSGRISIFLYRKDFFYKEAAKVDKVTVNDAGEANVDEAMEAATAANAAAIAAERVLAKWYDVANMDAILAAEIALAKAIVSAEVADSRASRAAADKAAADKVAADKAAAEALVAKESEEKVTVEGTVGNFFNGLAADLGFWAGGSSSSTAAATGGEVAEPPLNSQRSVQFAAEVQKVEVPNGSSARSNDDSIPEYKAGRMQLPEEFLKGRKLSPRDRDDDEDDLFGLLACCAAPNRKGETGSMQSLSPRGPPMRPPKR